MNISSHKNTILIIVVVLLAFFGYWFFFLSKSDAAKPAQTGQSLTTTRAPASAGNTQYDKEFVTSLLGLNSVNLDVSIFQSRVYQALSYPEVPFVVNYSRESGRDNPFLPIGVDAAKTQNVQTQVNANAPVQPVPTTTTAPVTAPSPAPKTTAPATPAATPTPTPKKF